MSNKRTASLIFIFITILIDVIGIGLIIPVLPNLLKSFFNNDSTLAAQWSGILIAVYALMQLIFSPIIGGLSDQYGRRPVLLFSLFTFGLDYILLALAPNIGWLFVGRIIAGISGASFTTAAAYIADISSPEDRGKNFGLVGAAFGLGFIIGPLLGGVLSDIDLRLPFWVAAALTFTNFLYGYFILPESLIAENRRKFSIKRANFIGSLLQLKKYPVIYPLLAALTLLYISGQVHPSTWAFFNQKVFNWNGKEVGYSLAFVGLVIAFVQGFLIRKTNPILGQRKSIFIGLAFYSFGFFLYSIANQPWMMFAFMIPFGLGGIAGPNLQGAISSQVPPNAQGELQGALTILMSLTLFIGGLLHTNLFSYFSSDRAPVYFPGAAFLAGSILSLFSLLILLKFMPKNIEPIATESEK